MKMKAARVGLKSSFIGGYKKETVLEYIELLLKQRDRDKEVLESRLDSCQQLMSELERENSRLRELLSFYQEKEKTMEQQIDQTVKMLILAEKAKAEQMVQLDEKREKVLEEAKSKTQTIVKQNEKLIVKALLMQQQEMYQMLNQFSNFMQNSAEEYQNVCEDIAASISVCQKENQDMSKEP